MQTVIERKQFEVQPEPADFWQWVSEGRYNSEWNILAAHLRPEHTFLDLGAWVGSHSLFASTIAREVVSVEPDPVAFKILEGNVCAHPNIKPVRVAIAGREGHVVLGSGLLGASTTRLNRHAGAGIGAWEPGQEFSIESTTLRKFVETHNLPDPLFIKMDIEGSEEEILTDADFFADRKPTLYLETHAFWWRDPAATWEAVRKIGSLYNRTFGINLQPIDLRSLNPSHVLFTDQR